MASILIVHPDRKTQRMLQRILGVTGHRVDIADDLQQGERLVGNSVPVLVCLDGSAFAHDDTARFLAFAKERGAEACMTLLGGEVGQLPAILSMGSVTNLLVHPMPVLGEELLITALKLIKGDLFGAEKYLLWGTDLHETTVVRGSQRAELVGRIAAQVRARGQSARVASMAMLVADELISNAIHNAPIDATGAHHRRDLPRDKELDLDEAHQVRVRWGCDARYLAIEVADRFGSLDRDTILGSLAKKDVRESGAGAGMGVALTYRSCDHLVFNLAPGKRTEVIALVDVRPANPGGAERGPASSFNVFVERA